MDNEIYAEQSIRRKIPVTSYLIEALMTALTIVSAFIAMFNPLGTIFLLASGTGTYFVFRNAKVEYEYLVVSGTLSVDKIFGQSARKNAWEASIQEILIIAPADSFYIKEHDNNTIKVINFTSGFKNREVYAVVSHSGGQKTKVLFEPNEKILNCLRQVAPSKVIKS